MNVLDNYTGSDFCGIEIKKMGSCGNNCSYIYDGANYLLEIVGGTMYDWGTGVDEHECDWKNVTSLIQTIVISGTKNIGKNSFVGATSLTSVIMQSSVETIGENAFVGCTALETINLVSGLKTIKKNAFSGCSGIESIIIPEGVTTIEDGAFGNMEKLKTVTIPPSVEIGSTSVFSESKQLSTIIMKGNGAMKEYDGTNQPWNSIKDQIKTQINI